VQLFCVSECWPSLIAAKLDLLLTAQCGKESKTKIEKK